MEYILKVGNLKNLNLIMAYFSGINRKKKQTNIYINFTFMLNYLYLKSNLAMMCIIFCSNPHGQLSLSVHDLCLEVLTLPGNVQPVFGSRHPLHLLFICNTPDISAVYTIFNVFSYDAVLDRDSNTLPKQN